MAKESKVRSRPRLAGERMAALLDIAAEIFIADGFRGASVNVIAQRAGASKASLYSRFPTKEDLFLAVLEHRMNHIFEGVSATVAHNVSLREALLGFGTELLRSGLSETQIALIRVISMETARFPQLGLRFFNLGPARGLAVLSEFLKMQIGKGALRDEDPEMMAQLLIGMIAGPPLLQRLLGITSPVKTAKHVDPHLGCAVEAFLLAYGT